MTAWVELALGSHGEDVRSTGRGRVAALPPFAERRGGALACRPAGTRKRRTRLASLDRDAGRRAHASRCRDHGALGAGPHALPQVRAACARRRLPPSLDELADVRRRALRALKGSRAGRRPCTRIAAHRMAHRRRAGHARARKTSERPTLRLSAPGDGETALDAVFRLARAVVDAAPFFFWPSDDEIVRSAGRCMRRRSICRWNRRPARRSSTIAASIAMHWFGNDGRRAPFARSRTRASVARRAAAAEDAAEAFPRRRRRCMERDHRARSEMVRRLASRCPRLGRLHRYHASRLCRRGRGRPVVAGRDRRRRRQAPRRAHEARAARCTRSAMRGFRLRSSNGWRDSGCVTDDAPVALADFAKKRIRKHYRKIVERA